MSQWIKLAGREFEVVRDLDENPVVIERSSTRQWRPADPATAAKVLAGLGDTPVLVAS